jgi:hypothetical protein
MPIATLPATLPGIRRSPISGGPAFVEAQGSPGMRAQDTLMKEAYPEKSLSGLLPVSVQLTGACDATRKIVGRRWTHADQ